MNMMMNLALRGIVLGLLCRLCVSCPIGKICDGKQHNEKVGDRRLEILDDAPPPPPPAGGAAATTAAAGGAATPGKPAADVTKAPDHDGGKPTESHGDGTTASDASPCIPISLAVLAASLYFSVIWLS